MVSFLYFFFLSLLRNGEFFVSVLVACGFLMISISSLLPKGGSDKLEWWER